MSYKSNLQAPDGAELIDRLQPVYAHWQELRDGSTLPRWTGWDWLQLPLDVIPWCAVVDVIGDADDFMHRFWGTARRDLFNAEYTGKLVSEMSPAPVASKSARELVETYKRREPIYVTTTGYDFGGRPSQYHMLRLPFAENQQVSQILSAVIFERDDIKTVQQFMTGEF